MSCNQHYVIKYIIFQNIKTNILPKSCDPGFLDREHFQTYFLTGKIRGIDPYSKLFFSKRDTLGSER